MVAGKLAGVDAASKPVRGFCALTTKHNEINKKPILSIEIATGWTFMRRRSAESPCPPRVYVEKGT
jgi:hypothetical protein